LSLYLTKHHAMKTYWGGSIAPRILDLCTRRRWMASFTPERAPITPCTGGRGLYYFWVTFKVFY